MSMKGRKMKDEKEKKKKKKSKNKPPRSISAPEERRREIIEGEEGIEQAA